MINTSFISTIEDYETETYLGITVHYFDVCAEFEICGRVFQVGHEVGIMKNENSHYVVKSSACRPCMFRTYHAAPDKYTREDMRRFCRSIIENKTMFLDWIRFEESNRKHTWFA